MYIQIDRYIPDSSVGKESACNAGNLGLIPVFPSPDPLEKEMATYLSILTWRIPWTEEPGGLQSRHNKSIGLSSPHI